MSYHNILRRQLPKGKPFDVEIAEENGPSAADLVHRHDYYEIVWPLEGEEVHSIDFVQYPLKPNQIFLIAPGQVYETLHYNGKLCVILFEPDTGLYLYF